MSFTSSKLIRAGFILDLIEEIKSNPPLEVGRTIELIIDGMSNSLSITGSTRTNLEDALALKLKELEQFSIRVKVQESFNEYTEIRILDFRAPTRKDDRGKFLTLHFRTGELRAAQVDR